MAFGIVASLQIININELMSAEREIKVQLNKREKNK